MVRETPLALVTLAILLLLLATTEVGRAIARRWPRADDKDAGALATGMLGIFALLIAFSFSMAVGRYDLRRQQVLQEANSIGSTANGALMLPPATRAAVLPLLRRYTEARIALGSPYERQAFAAEVGRANALLQQLWTQAQAATAEAPQSLPVYRFVSYLNDQTNVAEARITGLRNHVPFTTVLGLVGVAAVAFGLSGWSARLGGYDRHVGLGLMAVTVALLIALTLSLDRPNRGSIEVSKQPLQDALAALPAR